MSPPLKTLLFATQAFGREAGGGLGVSAARIVRHLATDWEVRVVVPSADLRAGDCRRSGRDGLVVFEVGAAGGSDTAMQHVADILDNEAGTAVEPVFAAFYCHRLAHTVTLAAALRRRPVVLFARGNDIDLEVFGPHAMQILHAIDAACRVFCVSSEMEAKIRAYRPAADVRFVANGVDTARFRLQSPPTGHDRPVVGLFGDVKQKKGLEILLEALDFSRFDLHIVGSIREESRRLLHGFLTLHPNARDHLVVRPFTCDEQALVAHYGEVDFVCIPSLHEGMSNVMLEALACGRPCVCSAVGGARDVIVDGENGFLYPPRSVPALAAAIERAASALRADAAGLARAARSTAERYSAAIERDRYLREFAAVAS
jgi:glycosyltransferase involved in cell wall biosynthesis